MASTIQNAFLGFLRPEQWLNAFAVPGHLLTPYLFLLTPYLFLLMLEFVIPVNWQGFFKVWGEGSYAKWLLVGELILTYIRRLGSLGVGLYALRRLADSFPFQPDSAPWVMLASLTISAVFSLVHLTLDFITDRRNTVADCVRCLLIFALPRCYLMAGGMGMGVVVGITTIAWFAPR